MNEDNKTASPVAFSIEHHRSRRLDRIAKENPSKLALFKKIYAFQHTRNQAIKGLCLDCMGFDTVGIGECGDRLCPLWKFRPFQKKGAA